MLSRLLEICGASKVWLFRAAPALDQSKLTLAAILFTAKAIAPCS
jgi:hypothetical protein